MTILKADGMSGFAFCDAPECAAPPFVSSPPGCGCEGDGGFGGEWHGGREAASKSHDAPPTCDAHWLGADPGPPMPRGWHLHVSAAERQDAWEEACARVSISELGLAEVGRETEEAQLSVVVFDDRTEEDAPFLRWCRRVNERHCRAQSIDLYFELGPNLAGLSTMPPHWARVARLRALASEVRRGHNQFVAVLDSDAVFANSDFPLRHLLAGLPAHKSVFVAKDPAMYPPPAGDFEGTGVFCTGFVLVRLDDRGLQFLDAWLESFDASQWSLNSQTGRWSTGATWAGPAYEQGQLNRLLRSEFQASVFELPQALFNSSFLRSVGVPQPLVLHLMRRPGEWSVDKDRRVEDTLRDLWGQRQFAETAGGAPTTSASLAVWEAFEELGP